MRDALFADQGGLEDPHLWTCVRDDFRGGVKAGIATPPTLFAAGERHTSPLDLTALERLIQQPS
jgi:hypothetical protein